MASSSSSSPEFYAAEPLGDSHTRFSYKDATQEEVLEDLSSRFILNLPDEELNSLERVCFQVEQAHWFYEDFIREENTKLPSMPLKRFSEMLFHACPLLQQWSHDHEEAFKNFMQYKTRVPVCGAIMLNNTLDKCVLVKGWKASSNWGFPKGKINETEHPTSCAIREVLEETGYNIATQIDPANVIELTIKEQKISLFIVPGVPEDFNFQTKTRKEISQIAWFKLSDLPTWKKSKSQLPSRKFYLISPFISPLKSFIHERRQFNGTANAKQKKITGQTNGLTRDEIFANGIAVKHPQATQHVRSPTRDGVANPHPSENDLGPELSRLFSGLTILSNPTVHGIPDASGSDLKFVESCSDPSDSSIDSPIISRAQTTSAHSTSHFKAKSVSTSDGSTILRSQPSRSIVNGTGPLPHSQAESMNLIPLLSSPTKSFPSVRKASSTADISPYLSNKNELSVSTKTLQHLQLLEAVADESARMAPILAARAAVVRQAATPTSALTNSQTQSSSPQNRIYSSGHPSNETRFPNPLPMTDPIYTYQDPLQLRSKTSQSFNRPTMHNPSSSMSMHQNQLLAVINGVQSVPVTPNHPHHHFVQPQPPLHNIITPVVHPSTVPYLPCTTPSHGYGHPLPSTAPPISPTSNSLAYAQSHALTPVFNPLPGPMSNPLVHPVPPANSSSGINMSLVPNPLLSILNGRPS